jgi:hypothetical protein
MLQQPMSQPSTRAWLARLASAMALAITFLGLSAAVAQDREPPRVRIDDNGAIEDLLRDRTIRGTYADGTTWIEYHAPNGLTAYWDGCTHPGEWWVADGLLCYRYPEDPAGEDYCWFVFQNENQLEFVDSLDGVDGPVGGTTEEITVGNSAHLPLGASDCLSAAAGAPSTAPLLWAPAGDYRLPKAARRTRS